VFSPPSVAGLDAEHHLPAGWFPVAAARVSASPDLPVEHLLPDGWFPVEDGWFPVVETVPYVTAEEFLSRGRRTKGRTRARVGVPVRAIVVRPRPRSHRARPTRIRGSRRVGTRAGPDDPGDPEPEPPSRRPSGLPTAWEVDTQPAHSIMGTGL
jgi:hypothetical protein